MAEEEKLLDVSPIEGAPDSAAEKPAEASPGPTLLSPAADEATSDAKKKIEVLLKAVGDTPIMKTKKWTMERSRTIQSLMDFIKRFLKLEPAEQLFIYVNQSFAPSPDQEVGMLYEEAEDDKQELKREHAMPHHYIDLCKLTLDRQRGGPKYLEAQLLASITVNRLSGGDDWVNVIH